MRKINLSLLIILGFLLMDSCKKDNSDSGQIALIPLNTGNYWILVDSTYNMDNWFVDTSKTEVGQFISIGGYSGFLNIRNGVNQYHLNFLANNDKDGNFINVGGYSDKDTMIIPSIEFKNKPYKGEIWQSNMIYGSYDLGTLGVDTVVVSCNNLDTLINVPKGSFKCNVYEFNINHDIDVDKFIYYISRGTGIVKTQHYEGKVLQSVACLIDYKLK
jgi:hypothetical protein